MTEADMADGLLMRIAAALKESALENATGMPMADGSKPMILQAATVQTAGLGLVAMTLAAAPDLQSPAALRQWCDTFARRLQRATMETRRAVATSALQIEAIQEPSGPPN